MPPSTLADLNQAIEYHKNAHLKANDPEARKDHNYALEILRKQRDKKLSEVMANGHNQVGFYQAELFDTPGGE